jgi:hypothetical protein
VRQRVEQPSSGSLDRLPDLLGLVGREVVHHHDPSRTKPR